MTDVILTANPSRRYHETRFADLVANFFRTVLRVLSRKNISREMACLSDRQLRDIGLTRHDISTLGGRDSDAHDILDYYRMRDVRARNW